jgi:hypothetical protein
MILRPETEPQPSVPVSDQSEDSEISPSSVLDGIEDRKPSKYLLEISPIPEMPVPLSKILQSYFRYCRS